MSCLLAYDATRASITYEHWTMRMMRYCLLHQLVQQSLSMLRECESLAAEYDVMFNRSTSMLISYTNCRKEKICLSLNGKQISNMILYQTVRPCAWHPAFDLFHFQTSLNVFTARFIISVYNLSTHH